jgi:hypothetical protein
MSMQVFPTAPSPTVTHLMNLVTELAAAALIALPAASPSAAARASNTWFTTPLLLPTSRGCLQQCACINAASSSFFSLLYTTWGSDRGVGVANLIFICSPNCCNILLFISFKFELGCL